MVEHSVGSRLLPNLGAFVLASLSAVGMLFVMAQTQNPKGASPKPELMVRPVSITPPPPPPPRVVKTITSKPIVIPSLSAPSTSSQVVLETTPIDIPLDMSFQTQITSLGPVDFEPDVDAEVHQALQMDFSFEDMDQYPRLLHHGGFKFTFPKELSRRRITQGKVELSVEIDEKGQAKILGVVSAQYRSLIPIAKRMVSMSRFTIPTVEGRKVKVTGVWPVVLNAPKKR
jgi:outer membrane biosynthesis protein TonB